MKHSITGFLIALLASAGLAACTGTTSAPLAATYHIVPPSSAAPHGHTWQEWQGLWWNWCNGNMPPSHHPLFDTGPVSEQQSGDVWFLGGILSRNGQAVRTQVTRTATLPRNTALFFPMINFYSDSADGWPYDQIESGCRSQWTGVQSLTESVVVDGASIPNLGQYHVEGPFVMNYRDSNVYYADSLPPEFPRGLTPEQSPAFAIGDYLMVDSLTVGAHSIHLRTTTAQILIDVTYTLTVQ